MFYQKLTEPCQKLAKWKIQEGNISIINNKKEKRDKSNLVVFIIQAFRLRR